MEIIVYTQFNNRQKEKLQSEIMEALEIKPVMVFDFESFFDIIRNEISDEVIIVFLLSFEDELDSLICSKGQLLFSRYIIIPPTIDNKVISKCLSLFPRYIANPNYDLKDVSAVLNKMVRNHMQYTKNLQTVSIQNKEKS